MKKLRIGIIGFGVIGQSHYELFEKDLVKDAIVNAICINGKTKKDEVLNKIGDKLLFYDYVDLLKSEDVDAVIIATPHYTHPKIVKEAYLNDKHILCEKPFGVSYNNLTYINNLSENKKDIVFSLMMNQRTNPLIVKIKKLIDNNELGDIRRLHWHITNNYRPEGYFNSSKWRGTWKGEGGGVLINQGFHNIDLIRWFMGMPLKVSSKIYYGKHHDFLVDDDVNVYFEFKNNVVGNLILSTHEWPGTDRLEISGSKGRIVLENDKLIWNKYEIDEEKHSKETKSIKSWDNYKYKTFVYEDKIEQRIEHLNIINNFISCINYRNDLISPGIEGIESVKLCNMIYLSDWLDKPLNSYEFNPNQYDRYLNFHIEKEICLVSK